MYPFELGFLIEATNEKALRAHPYDTVNPKLFDMIDCRDPYGVSNQANCGRDPKFSRAGRAFQ